jgi:hypothetical protein
VLVSLTVMPDEPRRRAGVRAEDRARYQVTNTGLAGRVDRVAHPGEFVMRRAAQQEHLVDARHGLVQRAGLGQVSLHLVDTRHRRFCRPGQDAYRGSARRKQPDELLPGPAPSANYEYH